MSQVQGRSRGCAAAQALRGTHIRLGSRRGSDVERGPESAEAPAETSTSREGVSESKPSRATSNAQPPAAHAAEPQTHVGRCQDTDPGAKPWFFPGLGVAWALSASGAST